MAGNDDVGGCDGKLVDQGRWLVEHRRGLEAAECEWLLALAAFDDQQGWAVDGMASCVDWLRWRTKMARATCYEKVWVAHQLADHPHLAQAYGAGRITYSAVRLIARLDNLDADTEAVLVDLAEHATIRHLEFACRHHHHLADQERPPPAPVRDIEVRQRPYAEGWTKTEIIAPNLESQQLAVTLDAFQAADRRTHHTTKRAAGSGGSSARAEDHEQADDGRPDRPAGESDPSARAEDHQDHDDNLDVDSTTAGESDLSARAEDHEAPEGDESREAVIKRWKARRGSAFFAMVHCALTHINDTTAAPDDRYLVHVVARAGQLTLIDGTPIDPDTARAVCCDTSMVAHTVDDRGEPLHLGRRTRTWTTAQRRAATVRDAGTCRFIGCEHKARHLHHQVFWSAGGATDIGNAVSLCHFHHQALHHGFTTTPTRDGGLAFHRPDGTLLGITYPHQRTLDLDLDAA